MGGSCVLSVGAVGSTPLLYQWRFNGTNLSGKTWQTLALANVTLNQAGAYSVEVRNEIGSILSQQAIITVMSGSGVLTNANQVTLQSYLDAIPVTFAFQGTMLLTNPLSISKNAVLDATGTRIVLDGGNNVRHYRPTAPRCDCSISSWPTAVTSERPVRPTRTELQQLVGLSVLRMEQSNYTAASSRTISSTEVTVALLYPRFYRLLTRSQAVERVRGAHLPQQRHITRKPLPFHRPAWAAKDDRQAFTVRPERRL